MVDVTFGIAQMSLKTPVGLSNRVTPDCDRGMGSRQRTAPTREGAGRVGSPVHRAPLVVVERTHETRCKHRHDTDDVGTYVRVF